MRNIHYIGAALALALPTITAATPNPSIKVTAQPVTVASWTKNTGRLLDDNLARVRTIGAAPDGTVTVKFLCSEEGVPSGVALLRSSGSARVDRLAIDAVSKIATLHPLPDGMGHSQKFAATIIYARDQASYDRQLIALRKTSNQQNAMAKPSPTKLALGVALLNDDETDVRQN